MRNTRRSVFSGAIVIGLLVMAVLLGYITDHLLTNLEKEIYPTDFSESITECAGQYDLDVYIVYGLIKELSDFSSNHVSADGRIGLMQLSEDTFLWLTTDKLQENLDVGLLYEPKTNIRYGCYYLLYLTTRYESWDAVYAAYLCGTEMVDEWYAQWKNSATADFKFEIQDPNILKKVNKIQRSVEKYKKLYDLKGDVTS